MGVEEVVEEWDDAAALKRIAAGDEETFKLFFERWGGRVLAMLRQLCRDSVLAEDLLQDVFLQVWRRAATYRPDRGSCAAWVFTIARNRVIDHRRRQSDRFVDGVDLTAMPGEPRGDEARIGISQALSGLPPEQRRAVEMAYFGGFTYAETAERLEIPLGTLKSRIRLGLMRMRSILEGSLA